MKLAFPTIVREYVRPGLVLAASRQRKLWQLTEVFYEKQAKLNDLATDKGVRRLARGIPGLDANRLFLDAESASVRKQAAAHAKEANRRSVPGTPWFFIKIGTGAPKLVRPTAYNGEAFATLLDKALGR